MKKDIKIKLNNFNNKQKALKKLNSPEGYPDTMQTILESTERYNGLLEDVFQEMIKPKLSD